MASKQYQTPDVYVEEIATFPPSVAEVGTAIPAFVGYTQQGPAKVPTEITSFTEFEALFGGPHADAIKVTVNDSFPPPANSAAPRQLSVSRVTVNGSDLSVGPVTPGYLLYWSLKHFFDNGGGRCYIVSVGNYADDLKNIKKDDLIAGLATVALEDEPTLLVVPEAVLLSANDYAPVAQQMLKQCGDLMDRFAILDAYDGDETDTTKRSALITQNRSAWTGALKYGAAYYPFVLTAFNHFVAADESNVEVTYADTTGKVRKKLKADGTPDDKDKVARLQELTQAGGAMLDTQAYNLVKSAMKDSYVTLPPSGAVAGVYAATDAARGVWKSPANVALNDVLGPVVKLSSDDQEGLNVDATTGKSINAIRAFSGKGTLVWGARTLAGNDNEWRYISVRRFFNMVEESVKKSTSWAVFEPNDANLWVKVRGMIENYLTDKWRDGALAGATPKDAFFVRCGLGTTMTAQDILQGRLNVEIGMAVVRPAEFIVLKFSHKLQTS